MAFIKSLCFLLGSLGPIALAGLISNHSYCFVADDSYDGARLHSSMIEVCASGGADGVYVHWLGGDGSTPDSTRVAVQIQPNVHINYSSANVYVGDISVLPIEATVNLPIAGGETEITKARADLIRASVLRTLPIKLLSIFRDRDRGITEGLDVLSLRIPIRIGRSGSIVILRGVDLG
ncbi:hypothetical protein WDW86_22145, partial [Bdellovibrionota bacterium FG-2]